MKKYCRDRRIARRSVVDGNPVQEANYLNFII